MLFWSIVFYSVNAVVHFPFMNATMSPVLIALLNTVFRAATILVLLPFIKWIEKIVYLVVKDSPEDEEDQADFDLLEERFLAYPDLAITQSHLAMNGMAKKARKNILRALSLFLVYSTEKFNKVQDKETLIDKYEDWYYANPLIEAVKSGKVPMSLVDEKVGDVLRVMIKTNVLDPKKRFGPGSMNTKEHQQATYDAAAEAIVLLKNQNNLLPLDFSSIKSLAVIGDNATRKHSNGGLSSEIKAVYEVTPLEALRAKWGDKVDIRFAQGYEKLSTFVEGSNNGQSSGTFSSKTQESDALLKEAVEVARTSDVALLVCGLNHDYDTESFDRLNMDIPYGQVELIQEVVKANPRTIVVMIAGSPLNMAAVDICSPAIVWAWFNGMEGGNALVDVLSGKVNPSGKMPFTTPVSLDQSPAHALGNFPGRDLKVNYEEDILVGYRWFDTKGLPVVYPFGYGLSYTTFDYSNLNTDKETYDQADTIQATFTLTNTGDREGAEVAQLYVSDPVCSVMRPVKELKGFKKVFLKPGESRRITLDIPVSSLAFYSEAQSQFVVEPGEFILQLGASASDIKQRISVEVK